MTLPYLCGKYGFERQFNMKWYGIVSLVFILIVLGGIVYVGANPSKLGIDFGAPSQISRDMSNPSDNSDQQSVQPEKRSADCDYWYSQWQLVKSQRDSYSPLSAKYLQFDMEMDEKMVKINEACYGK